MIQTSPARPHDLLRLRAPGALIAEAPVPPWVEAALREIPWVVVRRGHVRAGLIPVGVRGATRAQRFAAFVAAGEIAERRAPEHLIRVPAVIDRCRRDAVPALAALARISPILGSNLAHRGQGWGPSGSVGFEVATGAPATTPTSDLDLVLRQERRLETGRSIDLLTALIELASPARLDVMLETPHGGVSLADWAAGPARVLVRTADGRRLCADPWMADEVAELEAQDEAPHEVKDAGS